MESKKKTTTKEAAPKKTVKKETLTKKSGLVVDVFDLTGKVVGEIELPKEVFGGKVNKQLVSQAIRVYLTNQRAGRASTKTRGEVAGGGRKPWRQKGTGRARIGSIRAPHWRGGGVIHGPVPREFYLSLPKKMKKAALISALSDKLLSKEIVVLNKIEFKEPKTKLAAQMIKDLGVTGKNMIVLAEKQAKEEQALRNLPKVKTVVATEVNTYDVLNFKNLLLTKDSVEKIKDYLVGK